MDYVSLKSLSEELGMDRSHMRRYVMAKGFNMLRIRTSDSRSQLTLALAAEDAETLREMRQAEGYGTERPAENGHGFFYVVQIIPEFAPNRVKLGFAVDVTARLQAHRTAAPTAQLARAWPCHRAWEETAIASLARCECVLIANEVYECENLANLIARGDAFFALLP